MSDSLAAYLHDHWAGSSFAVELLEKLASEFRGTSSGDVAKELLKQVQMDRDTLRNLIERVGEVSLDLKDLLGRVAERISRFKLGHDDPTDVGALEAFETISLGILGKRCLWEALRVRQTGDARLRGPDYDGLIHRAEQQYRMANEHRLRLVDTALSQQ